MDFTIRPMTHTEHKYSYTRGTAAMAASGCIGHLRGDMGRDGEGFYTTWFDHKEDLKTQDFKDELDIGFGFDAASTETAEKHKNISYDDLIRAGMRREIAGRINRIVALNPLTVSDYKSILMGPVLAGLQESHSCAVSIDRAAGNALAEQAIASGLGVRWMRSALLNMIDDVMFDSPDAQNFSITARDGKLCCRARGRRKAPPAERPRRSSSRRISCDPMEDCPF